MKLVETTMFGVRPKAIRIKKRSPLAQIGAGDKVDFHLRSSGQVPMGDAMDGHSVKAEYEAAKPCAPWAEGMKIESTGRSGGIDLFDVGLLVWISALALLFLLQLDLFLNRRDSFPDPVCERCGQVLDGNHKECFEEDSLK